MSMFLLFQSSLGFNVVKGNFYIFVIAQILCTFSVTGGQAKVQFNKNKEEGIKKTLHRIELF